MQQAGGQQERLSMLHYDGNNASPETTIQACNIILNDLGVLRKRSSTSFKTRSNSILSSNSLSHSFCAETSKIWKNICFYVASSVERNNFSFSPSSALIVQMRRFATVAEKMREDDVIFNDPSRLRPQLWQTAAKRDDLFKRQCRETVQGGRTWRQFPGAAFRYDVKTQHSNVSQYSDCVSIITVTKLSRPRNILRRTHIFRIHTNVSNHQITLLWAGADSSMDIDSIPLSAFTVVQSAAL